MTESDGVIIGIGEYHVLANGEEAEVAFAVADAHHHEGVATVLLEDLALIAKAAGLRRLVADTLAGNAAMLAVFRSVGLVYRDWFEDGVIHIQLDLTGEHLLQDDADLRDWRSAVKSLRSLVSPSHVIVIGAGRDPASPGRRILDHLARPSPGGQRDAPDRGTIGGIDAVTGFGELDGVPDLAIVAVPARVSGGGGRPMWRRRRPHGVVISAGFAELGGPTAPACRTRSSPPPAATGCASSAPTASVWFRPRAG